VDKKYGLLLGLALATLFLALGANSIWDANEAFYVDTPRQMVLSGDYVTPTFNGEPRLNKPVLSYWIVAGAYNLFGVSVTTERFVIALGALGILAATFVIGRTLRSTVTGLLAALVVASAPRFVHFARRNMIDIYLTLFMSVALAAFVLAREHPQARWRYLSLMYVAIGLGVLTKGPVALVLPAAVIAAWLVMERQPSALLRLHVLPGALIVLAIVVPWYAALYFRHGWEPIHAFFVGENIGRFTNAMTADRSPLFLLGVLFGDILMPWAPLLLIPMWSGWRRATGESDRAPIRRLLWVWIVLIVVGFSLSASKEDLYILPVAPAAAALIADALVESDFGRLHRGIRATLGVVCCLVAVLGGAIWWLLGSGYYQIAHAPVVALVLILGGLVPFGLLIAGRYSAAFAGLASAFVIFNLIMVWRVLPGIEPLKPVPPLADAIRARASAGGPVASFNLSQPSLIFYLGRPVPELGSDDEAVSFIRDRPEAWLVTGESEWGRIQSRLPGACVALTHPRFDARLPDVLRGVPPPAVMLVTNRCKGAVLPAR
jgi:4-amino-4-deoxy-L-arabinose transferase-like glycosyltransferase